MDSSACRAQGEAVELAINLIERFIREIDRKFERVGVFPSAKSWERMTYLVYKQFLENGYRPTQPESNFTRNF